MTLTSTAAANGNVSYWFCELGIPEPADVLEFDAEADVAIVGAGFTGLWTAYYLLRADPRLRVRVLEERFAGYGASGRNGGWLANSITGGHTAYAKLAGAEATRAFQLALNNTVDEVIRVAEAEGIDAGIRKGGSLIVARTEAQLARRDALWEHARAWPEEGYELLDRAAAAARVRIDGVLGALWTPHCARLDPARLVAGLARAVRGLGGTIHEGTRVESIEPGRAVTARGTVRARQVIRATEGFTTNLAGEKRTWVPMNSSMVITEPLPASAWGELGWERFDTIEHLAHAYCYVQRTPDGRIALGGRGNPYRFGSRTDNDGSIPPSTIGSLAAVLREWFPAAAGARIAHGWSGVLGVPRNWRATVGLDPATGLGWAGGYVGTGVTATNLAGRTLADLVLGHDTPITRLPWVNQRARRWEPEPLRWLGIQGLYAGYRWADAIETRRGGPRTSVIAHVADVVSGKPH